jgi:hypothetical protein
MDVRDVNTNISTHIDFFEAYRGPFGSDPRKTSHNSAQNLVFNPATVPYIFYDYGVNTMSTGTVWNPQVSGFGTPYVPGKFPNPYCSPVYTTPQGTGSSWYPKNPQPTQPPQVTVVPVKKDNAFARLIKGINKWGNFVEIKTEP